MLSSILCTFLLATSIASTALSTKTTEDVQILPIEQKSDFNFNDIKKGVIFTDENKINEYDTNNDYKKFSNEPIKVKKFGEYYYYDNSELKKGLLYCSEFSKREEINKLTNKVKNQINNGEICSKMINSPNISIGSDWEEISEVKVDSTLSEGTYHFGDFAEWQNFYYTKNNKSTYYLIVNQSFITPDTEYHGKYRTSNIKYNFNDNSSDFLLRDYGPKMRNPQTTISVGGSIGPSADSDGLHLNTDFSFSYEAIKNSPKILDQGNMSKDQVGINFRYEYPWANFGECFEYNINQTVQCTYYLIKEDNSNNTVAKALDNRIITMVYDSKLQWNNKVRDFSIDTYYTLDK